MLSAVTFPSITHLSLTTHRDQLPAPCVSAFPKLWSLNFGQLLLCVTHYPQVRPILDLYYGPPISCADFYSRLPLCLTLGLVEALTATVRTVTFERADEVTLNAVLQRWFRGRAEEEVGRLTNLVLRRQRQPSLSGGCLTSGVSSKSA